MKRRIFTVVIGLLTFYLLHSQTIVLPISQPDILSSSAGQDSTICPSRSIQLNGQASGGSEIYYYTWTPSIFLDDPTIAKPTCTPEYSIQYMLTVADTHGCTSTSFVSVFVDPCLGVDLNESKVDLRIFPNPSNGDFRITGLPLNKEEITISIVDQLGRNIESKNQTINYGSEAVALELEGTPPGIYFLRITISNRVFVKTIHIY